MKLPAAAAALVALAASAPTARAAEVILYNSLADGEGKIIGRSLYCETTQYNDGTYDLLQLCTDPWKGAALNVWNTPIASYSHVTFLAKADKYDAASCVPSFSVTCGWWPRYSSNAIDLAGPNGASYVEGGGALSATEWRQVSIPVSDLLAGSACESYTDFYSVNFNKCNPAPVYHVTDIRVTDSPPALAGPAPTTEAPTEAPTPYAPTVVWDEYVETSTSCFDARNNSTQVNANPDYLQLITDPWKGASLLLGRPCFPFSGGVYPDLTDAALGVGAHLTFLLRATGDFNPAEGVSCDPAVSMSGGHWVNGVGWSGQSGPIKIEHELIDYGVVSGSEYRQVSIPLDLFKTDVWDLNRVERLSFHHCQMSTSYEQPKYYVRDIQLTVRPPALASPYPTAAPTVRVTEDASQSTHREIHHHYYPILDDSRDASVWLEASDDQWPNVPADGADHGHTVHVPMGSTVTYSASTSPKLDKVVVHGTLIIEPAGADVLLTCGTLVVEMMGKLDVRTGGDGHTVTIEIDGALDTAADPEQTMVGLLNLGGETTISGDPVSAKMTQLKTAIDAGGTILVVDDSSGAAAAAWSVGDELILPDTKEGRDVEYWNYMAASGFQVPGETETVVIESMTTVGSGDLHIVLAAPTQFAHAAGCHAAHATRSVTIKSSATSADRGHVMHTGMGRFDVSDARFEDLGRTTTDALDLTALEDTGVELARGLARFVATHIGTNQIARYALHSHHSMIKVHWSGNVILNSPRNCMVMHNSFGDITDNVAVGCNGTAIFLESGTESGVVEGNFLIGTGGGTRGHDDGRFASGGGLDMAHGGFGIWARGMIAPIRYNHAEGVFGRSPYALFVHPLFVQDNVVPSVPGTNPALAGKTLKNIFYQQPVQLNTYGPFVNNTAFGTWRSALDLSYFSTPGVGVGHVIEGFDFTALAHSGQGIFTVHSPSFDLVDGYFEAKSPENAIVGVFCNNGQNALEVYYNNTVFDGVDVVRGGNC